MLQPRIVGREGPGTEFGEGEGFCSRNPRHCHGMASYQRICVITQISLGNGGRGIAGPGCGAEVGVGAGAGVGAGVGAEAEAEAVALAIVAPSGWGLGRG